MKKSCVGLLALLAVTCFGCGEEEEIIPGCTDAYAVNFNPEANEDNGTCAYEGTVLFWLSAATADSLTEEGISSLNIYFDSETIGSYLVASAFASAPPCDTTGVVTKEKNLGSARQQQFSYEIVNDFGLVMWTGSVNVNATFSCNRVEIIF